MPHALHFLVFTVAGWLNRHQEALIDYLREENRVLREQMGGRALRLTDAQRRRLAVRGQKLGRQVLTQIAGIVTPDTILRWYRQLIAKKYDGSGHRRRGRPLTLPPHILPESARRPPSQPEHGGRIACDQRVWRHDRQAAQDRLRHQAPVERIPMMRRQQYVVHRVSFAGQQHAEPGCLDGVDRPHPRRKAPPVFLDTD